jgi:uracil-DNA glycosylase
VTAQAGLRDDVAALRAEIAACVVCAPHLPAGARPVAQFAATARILIVGQAPGTRVHASGVPWDDSSGARLRDWTGLSARDFYDPAKVALIGMGLCYPGRRGDGDAPPRAECAPLWHPRILALLPADRLTLLVGAYAQARYLPGAGRLSLTERVRDFRSFGAALFPLPHPSWRVVGWARRHPWFEAEALPALRAAVRARLG